MSLDEIELEDGETSFTEVRRAKVRLGEIHCPLVMFHAVHTGRGSAAAICVAGRVSSAQDLLEALSRRCGLWMRYGY